MLPTADARLVLQVYIKVDKIHMEEDDHRRESFVLSQKRGDALGTAIAKLQIDDEARGNEDHYVVIC